MMFDSVIASARQHVSTSARQHGSTAARQHERAGPTVAEALPD